MGGGGMGEEEGEWGEEEEGWEEEEEGWGEEGVYLQEGCHN